MSGITDYLANLYLVDRDGIVVNTDELWLVDDRGNKVNVLRWDGLHGAMLVLQTLVDCENCVDSRSMTDCTNCSNSNNLTNCDNCDNCDDSIDLTDCSYVDNSANLTGVGHLKDVTNTFVGTPPLPVKAGKPSNKN